MKRLLFLLLSIAILPVHAQVVNVNPDSSGEPWLVGGLRVPSDAEIAKIPTVYLRDYAHKDFRDLPTMQDNSLNNFFRPIFNQADGSCSQASGIGYAFTYEMNRERMTFANVSSNQYPSHYTYNFLNRGSGDNGSFYTDGWEIVKANGCPSVETYGGMSITDTHWMSGYNEYEQGMNNRINSYFAIDVGTPEGLETLKYWFYNHLDDTSFIGGVVNFAAGVSDAFNMVYEGGDAKILEWGHAVNHAMTFVGWDDSITHDFNYDGLITNDIDINGDGEVDMRDWEQGALIMVNSWGTGWGDGGKAYVMYKTLAESVSNGGIHANKVYGINVKESQEPQLMMRVKMVHNERKKVQLIAGVSTDLSDTEPAYTITFPLIHNQGGEYPMRGAYSSSPIEISLDVSGLLRYVTSGENTKFFLGVIETDESNSGYGTIKDFSIIDADANIVTCSDHNVNIMNNDITLLSIESSVSFESPEILTNSLPSVGLSTAYATLLTADGGSSPYTWSIEQDYTELSTGTSFPSISTTTIAPSDFDDGLATQTLDFSFPFYGESFNQVYISTDGSIVFEDNFSYVRNEDAIKANKIIGVFAHDLLLEGGVHGIFYSGDADSATFRWIATTWEDTSATVDVAVTLYANGNIECFYGSGISTGLEWASGVSNGSGSFQISSISGVSNPSNSKYIMIPDDYPIGMSITPEGVFEGTSPSVESSWDIAFVVTDNNGIATTKVLAFTTSTVSVANYTAINVEIYPNPVSSFLHIVTTEILDTVRVYDSNAKLLLAFENNPTSIDLTRLERGIYFVKFQTKKGTTTQKIIIE